jgi:hypothetical protein
MILNGKKTLLIPIDYRVDSDIDYFLDLYEDEKWKHLYELKTGDRSATGDNLRSLFKDKILVGWTVHVLHSNDKMGVIFASFNADIPNVSGIMDKKATKGLLKKLKSEELTFTVDALKTVSNYIIEDLGFERVQTMTELNNRLSLKLIKKAGYDTHLRLAIMHYTGESGGE